jgi:hypothetical protein
MSLGTAEAELGAASLNVGSASVIGSAWPFGLAGAIEDTLLTKV